MKYQCKDCNYHWEGTSYTFNEVTEHEKTHLKKNVSKKIGTDTT